jgi:hypothetical protein
MRDVTWRKRHQSKRQTKVCVHFVISKLSDPMGDGVREDVHDTYDKKCQSMIIKLIKLEKKRLDTVKDFSRRELIRTKNVL